MAPMGTCDELVKVVSWPSSELRESRTRELHGVWERGAANADTTVGKTPTAKEENFIISILLMMTDYMPKESRQQWVLNI